MKYLRFYIFGFSMVCANSMVSMFLSLYLKSSGVSEVTIGGLLGTRHLMMPLVIFLLGFMADRISCKRLMLTGTSLMIIYCITMPHLHRTWTMSIGVGVEGIGLTLSFITANVLFLKVVQKKGKGKYLAIFVTAMTSGYAIGSSISSILLREFNLSPYFIFYAALPFHLTCFITALKMKEAPIEKFPLVKYFHDMKRFPVFCLATIAFSLGMHWGSEKFGTVRYLDEIIGATGFQMASMFLLTGITLAIFSRMAGSVIDNEKNFIPYLVFGIGFSGLMHALTSISRTFSSFLILRMLHTVGDSFIVFGIPMLVSMAFPRGRMGGNYGFNRTINSIGSTVGTAISGVLVVHFFLGTPFLVTGALQVVTAGWIWMVRNHMPSEHKAKKRVSEAIEPAPATE